MLYHLFEYIQDAYDLPGARLFQYITFRSGVALILSLLISIVFGERIIRSLKRRQVGETVRELGLQGQKQKEGTPTMGGVIILLAIVVPCILLADLSNAYIQLLLVSTVWMSAIGFADDYIKVFRKNKDGLKGKAKVFGQVVFGVLIGATMLWHQDIVVRLPLQEAIDGGYEIVKQFKTITPRIDAASQAMEVAYVKTTMTNVPFLKGNNFDYANILSFLGGNAQWATWLLYILAVVFIVTAVSNSANLTDGIDGLAAGISAIVGAVLGIFAYVSGNAITADFLDIFYIPHSGEMVIFSACFIGASVGFLWHNAFPAKVFMGDTGSLMLGGVIASMALLLRKELLLPILCGVFFMESLSVILQVSYFKYTKNKYGEGRRIFKMSPLHHHYQKMKMHESKIVTRFWIVGILLAVITIITLKIR